MRTVQMTLDEDLVRAVDRVAKELRTTRSAFAREALRQAVARVEDDSAARGEAAARVNLRQPAGAEEFGVWEKEQEWGDR